LERRKHGVVEAGEAPGAAEAEAHEQAGLFEAAFQYAGIGMALVGLDGSFLRLNDAFCQIAGHPEASLLKLDFQAITHPDDLDRDLDQLRRLNAGEISSYQMDKRYLRATARRNTMWPRCRICRKPAPRRPRCARARRASG
jgi:PAS domain S-box-containing protein